MAEVLADALGDAGVGLAHSCAIPFCAATESGS
jgi:hypothetical protein